MKKIRSSHLYLFIFIVGTILFIPDLGAVHLFDWDEINFAESAREMLMTDDYLRVQINYEPFWEKPPFFFWLQCIAMKIFGINEFAARFPNALVGIITLLTLFYVGKKVYDKKFGVLWALAYAGSFLPHFYFKSGIIDPLFNLFIFAAVYKLYCAFQHKDHRYTDVIIAGFFTGMAILTKGPVALLVSGLAAVIFMFLSRKYSLSDFLKLICFSVASLAVAALWFGIETVYNGTWFLETFLKYQVRLFNTEDSGHGQPVYYHPIVLFIGCFPASIFCIKALIRKQGNNEKEPFLLWMQLLFWIVLIIFSIVKTKIIHYSSLCYFPVTFLAIYVVTKADNSKPVSGWIKSGLVFVGFILGFIIAFLPFFVKLKKLFLPHINDVFAVANIDAYVDWTGLEALIGIFLLVVLIWVLFTKKDIATVAVVLFISVTITLQLTLYVMVPKIERHVQGALIDFLESTQNEDCYVKCIGFKSYAQYYYTNRKPEYKNNKDAENENWLIYGDIDKPVYLITKNDRDYYRLVPQLKLVTQQNGWVVYKRDKP